MVIHNFIQGSREWLQARCGLPTCSEFSRILTPGGALSKSADGYMHDLLAERMLQEPLVKAVSFHMQRGSEHEAEAVAYYELERGTDTVTVGFITNDEGTIGASPDRLIGDDGLLEIKVPSPGTHVGYLLNEAGAGDHYKQQTQGQLFVTGRAWVDVMSYCPGLPEALVRFGRDEEYIGRLAAAVSEFSSRLESFTAMFRDRGWITARKEPPAERPDEPRLFLNDDDLEWALTRSIEIHQKQVIGGESGGMA
jgi:hypothetical protein